MISIDFNGLVTVKEFADKKKISRRTVYRYLDGDNPPAHTQAPDGTYYIDRDALKSWSVPKRGRRPK
jgi:predicted DNA-binding transcriptional regulator YafY